MPSESVRKSGIPEADRSAAGSQRSNILLAGVALVTGAGRGIGASIARELAEAGMQVAVTGRTTEQVQSVAHTTPATR